MYIAVMASHGGSILQAVIDACEDGTVAAEVCLVISNNSDAAALTRAQKHGIATLHLSARTHANADELDKALTEALVEAKADWLLLAGYMKKLGPQTLEAYHNRILNTHPGLLPKYGGQGFFGRNVHQAVLDAGDAESGATVHLVEDQYDTGPILSQVRVQVKSNDSVESLEERVKSAERKLIVATLMELGVQRAARKTG
ncbi:MAG: phosphoribosylglycinamide formyltransferase [Gammaproteobacteria bacterium]|nr:phosphoribosylglycinamide formyltransferase [Gammaproteobacteria bacterium]